MELALSSSHDPLGIGWMILRLSLVALLVLPIIAGMVVAAATAYRKRHPPRHEPLRWSTAAWPLRRVMPPPPREHRPWRAHRRR